MRLQQNSSKGKMSQWADALLLLMEHMLETTAAAGELVVLVVMHNSQRVELSSS